MSRFGSRRVLFAALIATVVAGVTVAYPVISHQKNAASADKSRETAQFGPDGPAILPSKRPTAKPTAQPSKVPGTVSSKPPTAAPSKKPVPSSKPTGAPTTTEPTATTPPTKTEPSIDETAAGPAHAGSCSGVAIKPGQNAQAVVNSQPAGSTLCFASGLHRISQTIRPKANMTIASSARAVLTGSVPLTSWAKSGTRWVSRGALPAAYGKSGQCEDNKANICHLREQVYLDGTHLTRVASLVLGHRR